MPIAISTLDKDVSDGIIDSSSLLKVVSDIAAGLHEMHQMEMFHRDLKPQNVLRFSDSDGERYYSISDFGFVSLSDSRLSTLTHTGMAKGTDYYTAPEITRDLRRARAWTDIYSLGCIIHDVIGSEDRIPCAEIKEQGPYSALLRNCTRANEKKRFKSVAAVRDVLASIDVDLPPASDQAAVDLIQALDDTDLNKSIVQELVDFCEDNEDTYDGGLIFRRLTIENIIKIFELSEIDGNQIGTMFATWVGEGDFNFEYCDVLAERIQAFFNEGDLNLRADCLMALLEMGVRHNRWYVEEKFKRLTGPEMDEALAKRVSVEIRAIGDDFCNLIERFEGSIGTSRKEFHPIIVSTLNDLCS